MGPDGPDPCAAYVYVPSDRLDTLARVSHCREVRGLQLDFCDGLAQEVSLPFLERVNESLQVCLDAADAVSLPALRNFLGGYWDLRSDTATVALSGVSVETDLTVELGVPGGRPVLSGIVRVGGTLGVQGAAFARSLSLPDLGAAGTLHVNDGTDLLDLPGLTEVGGVWFGGRLASWLETPALLRVTGDARVFGPDFAAWNAAVLEEIGATLTHVAGPFSANVTFPALLVVGGDLDLGLTDQCPLEPCEEGPFGPPGYDLGGLERVGGALRLIGTRTVERFSLPRLGAAGALEIASNRALAALELPAVAGAVGEVRIVDNPALPACQAEDIAARAGAAVTVVERNGPACE